jgi:hypothetical protein
LSYVNDALLHCSYWSELNDSLVLLLAGESSRLGLRRLAIYHSYFNTCLLFGAIGVGSETVLDGSLNPCDMAPGETSNDRTYPVLGFGFKHSLQVQSAGLRSPLQLDGGVFYAEGSSEDCKLLFGSYLRIISCEEETLELLRILHVCAFFEYGIIMIKKSVAFF